MEKKRIPIGNLEPGKRYTGKFINLSDADKDLFGNDIADFVIITVTTQWVIAYPGDSISNGFIERLPTYMEIFAGCTPDTEERQWDRFYLYLADDIGNTDDYEETVSLERLMGDKTMLQTCIGHIFYLDTEIPISHGLESEPVIPQVIDDIEILEEIDDIIERLQGLRKRITQAES